MTELKHNYISVTDCCGKSYGGSQAMSGSAIIKKSGCGIVAAADLIIYLKASAANKIPSVLLPVYNRFLVYLNRKYFPLIPGLGMNSAALTVGLNLYFKKHRMPYRAVWQLSGDRLFSRIEEQLLEDIPVIMSVGPNFPLIWQKNRLNFYSKTDGQYIKSASAKAHFITATGIDTEYIKISSWGRELYIKKSEFRYYAKKHSTDMLCNMLQIKER